MAGSDRIRYEVVYWREGRGDGRAFRFDDPRAALTLCERVLGLAGPWKGQPLAPLETLRVDVVRPVPAAAPRIPAALDMQGRAGSVLRVVAGVDQRYGITPKAWLEGAGLPKPTFWRWQRKLAEAGLVVSSGTRSERRWRITRDGLDALEVTVLDPPT